MGLKSSRKVSVFNLRSFRQKNNVLLYKVAKYDNWKLNFQYRKFQSSEQKEQNKYFILSKYVWNLQNEKKPFQIKWKILKKCKPYSNISKKCSLCLNEKFIIICKKELCSLNRRNELASSCPHRNRYVLGNFRVT